MDPFYYWGLGGEISTGARYRGCNSKNSQIENMNWCWGSPWPLCGKTGDHHISGSLLLMRQKREPDCIDNLVALFPELGVFPLAASL